MLSAALCDREINLTQADHAMFRVCKLSQGAIWEDLKAQCLSQGQSYEGYIGPRIQCDNEMLAGKDHFEGQAWIWDQLWFS